MGIICAKQLFDVPAGAQVSDFVTTDKENSVKANKDYAGKWVKITGKISAISQMKA
jgi:hypothetical protein